ncbi:MAG: methyltransferase domain-containing protein [Oceanicaulis sp.]|nr:methyltransferase domain-containing protein [Oceanicaulis sp.]
MSSPAPLAAAPAHCPVCRTPGPAPFASVDGTDYWRCAACEATFMDPRHHLAPEAEHAQYRLHQNHPDDPGYRRFLSKLADPLMARLKPGARGLDYGCGPGPALAAMLTEAGHEMALYDPLFAPDRRVLEARYDFVACT